MGNYYRREEWRNEHIDDQARRARLQRFLEDNFFYSTEEIVGGGEKGHIQCMRDALQTIIKELQPNEVEVFFALGRLLLLQPRPADLFERLRERDKRFHEQLIAQYGEGVVLTDNGFIAGNGD